MAEYEGRVDQSVACLGQRKTCKYFHNVMTNTQITAAAQAGEAGILYFDFEYFSQRIKDTFCVSGTGGTKL
jgi:hypothetical protein